MFETSENNSAIAVPEMEYIKEVVKIMKEEGISYLKTQLFEIKIKDNCNTPQNSQ